MGALIARTIDVWRRGPFSRRPRFRGCIALQARAELPSTLPRQQLVILGDPGKWAVMACPCGRGHDINLNLANSGTTRWTITDTKAPSLRPSIDVQDPAGRCHFWLRDGRVYWVQPPRSRAKTRR